MNIKICEFHHSSTSLKMKERKTSFESHIFPICDCFKDSPNNSSTKSMIDQINISCDQNSPEILSKPNESPSENEIQKIIQKKMKKLERINQRLLTDVEKRFILTTGLTQKNIIAIHRFQIRVRQFLQKQRFFNNLRSEKLKEQKEAYQMLKLSLWKIDNRKEEKDETVWDVITNLF